MAEGEDQLMRGLVEHVLIVYVGVRNLMSVGVRNILRPYFTNSPLDRLKNLDMKNSGS